MAQLAKNPSAMQETQVWFLGWEDGEDPLEKEMALQLCMHMELSFTKEYLF